MIGLGSTCVSYSYSNQEREVWNNRRYLKRYAHQKLEKLGHLKIRITKSMIHLRMEKLFASKNIHILSPSDSDGEGIKIAYTNKLYERSVLIVIDGVSFHNSDLVPEEVTIFANLFLDSVLHSYVLYVGDKVLGPLPVFRIVADAIEYIEQCNPKRLVEELKEISMSYSSTDENFKNKQYYKNESLKFTTAMTEIRIKMGTLN